MAETTATVKPTTSVQAKKSSNIISLIAPVLCLLAGYFIWRIVLGNPANFGVPTVPGDEGWFWPGRHDPKSALSKMYLGGIIVPVLIGKGSVGNVMKAGLHRYKEMISNTELSTDQKVMAIQKEVEEATSLELPMLEKNLVFLSSIASLATLIGLLGTVVGMIRAFGTLGSDSGGSASAQALSVGISEALYNTALGIGTSAFAIMFYNIFTTKIDGITYGIDESGFTLTQTFASLYK